MIATALRCLIVATLLSGVAVVLLAAGRLDRRLAAADRAVATLDLTEAERAYAESRERMMGNLGSRLSTNRIIRDLAKENNVPMIDVQELFQQYGTSRQRYYNIDLIHDDCHPTPLGHQLISEVLEPLLRRVVADKPPR